MVAGMATAVAMATVDAAMADVAFTVADHRAPTEAAGPTAVAELALMAAGGPTADLPAASAAVAMRAADMRVAAMPVAAMAADTGNSTP
jgi:hypothetical protein